jgi:hypothetical protein
MSNNINVRWGWLKVMYIYTIVGAGGFGLGIIVIPNIMRSIFRWPTQDPIVYGAAGSLWLAFGLVAILGLRAPLKFVPLLLLQLCYKCIWLVGVFLPLLVIGKFPMYGILHLVIFVSYIIGDLIAIPFPYVFAKQTDQITLPEPVKL